MKTTSRLALVAATGLLIGTGSWSLSARAADLGGDCCSDLEERVAELEATTVRKGNRKVSLELSGQVDRALMFWNDGKNSDVASVDNSYSSTRFRLKGTAQMTPGWKAGFYQEIEFRDAASNTISQASETGGRGTDSSTGSLRLRQSNAFVESDRFGRVTVGLQNTATKDLTLTNLGGGMNDPENYFATGFKVRGSNASVSGLTWNNLSNALDGQRSEMIRYDSPSIFGFIYSAAFGQNDVWDTALRYQKEWNSIRIAGGLGYAFYGENFCNATATGQNNTNANGTCQPDGATAGDQVINENSFAGAVRGPGTKTEVVSGNISLMHVPTGLYVTFDAANRHFDNPAYAGIVSNKDASYFYTQFGITKRFFDVGATTVYGEFGDYRNFAVGDGGAVAINLPGAGGRVTSDDVTRWGIGFTQAFDTAATELFTNYIHYSADITTQAGKAQAEDFDAVISGVRIKF